MKLLRLLLLRQLTIEGLFLKTFFGGFFVLLGFSAMMIAKDYNTMKRKALDELKDNLYRPISSYQSRLVSVLLSDNKAELEPLLERIKKDEKLDSIKIVDDPSKISQEFSNCIDPGSRSSSSYLIPSCERLKDDNFEVIHEVSSWGATLGYLYKAKSINYSFWSSLRYVLPEMIFYFLGISFFSFMYGWRLRRHLIVPIYELIANTKKFLVRSTPQKYSLVELDSLSRSIHSAYSDLADYKEKEIQYASQREIALASLQVAHDIRSPLAALDMATSMITQVPEEIRITVRGAISGIRDIANTLSEKGHSFMEESKSKECVVENKSSSDVSVHLLSSLVETLVSEKRMQYRSRIDVEIETQINEKSYGLFAKVNAIEFKRVLSNIINNAVEAIVDKGRVLVSLEAADNGAIMLTVEDSGKGIPQNIIPLLTKRHFSYDKKGGQGLGLYHAEDTVGSWGGRLLFESALGKGTIVRMLLPREIAPSWFTPGLKITDGSTVVVLDDDSSIHQIWKQRIDKLDKDQHRIQLVHLSTATEAINWHKENAGKIHDILYLFDYELIGSEYTGLDLIELLGIQEKAILVTSRYDDPEIRFTCGRLSLCLIPKGLAGFIPISVPTLASAISAPDACIFPQTVS